MKNCEEIFLFNTRYIINSWFFNENILGQWFLEGMDENALAKFTELQEKFSADNNEIGMFRKNNFNGLS